MEGRPVQEIPIAWHPLESRPAGTRELKVKYRAPALEKGLDILEVLARAPAPLSMAQISERVGRSKGEIFRMLQVLEERKYITRRPGDEGYTLTNRLFVLGMEQPPVKGLLETALPIMHRLADVTWQSCHLVVASHDQVVVIARVDAPGEAGFVVRVGYRRALPDSTSGLVLFAFQPTSIRSNWLAMLDEIRSNYDREEFVEHADLAKARGFVRRPSDIVRGVIDLSAPILQHHFAIAALTVPFVERESMHVRLDDVIARVRDAASEISHCLQFGAAPQMPAVEASAPVPAPKRRPHPARKRPARRDRSG
jgi:DNA-binding IclR family transcriptional regulator